MIEPHADTHYRELIHQLNQRCRQEYERAEYLQKELAEVYSSRAWQLLTAWERAKQWFRSPSAATFSADACRTLTVIPGQPRSRVSIIIPFKDRPELLHGCLKSMRASSYRRFEV